MSKLIRVMRKVTFRIGNYRELDIWWLNTYASTPHCQNACLCHYSVQSGHDLDTDL